MLRLGGPGSRPRVLGANLGDTDLLPSFRTYPSMISAEDRGRSSEYVSGWWPLAAFLQRCGFWHRQYVTCEAPPPTPNST